MLANREQEELDFKNKLIKKQLIGINGIYYNRNEAGNYLWGAAANTYGYDYTMTYVGAQAYALVANRQFDDPHEVRAFTAGYHTLGPMVSSFAIRNFIMPGIKSVIPETEVHLPRFRW